MRLPRRDQDRNSSPARTEFEISCTTRSLKPSGVATQESGLKKEEEVDMRSWKQVSLLVLCVVVLMASTPGKPAWQMKADYVEACSCHLFCPCYFNKHAEHPHCEFNMAVKVREGHSGNTNLAGV